MSTTQEVFKLDAPGFRKSNAILSPEGNACIDRIRQHDPIPGISVGVVRIGEDKEPSRRRDGGQRARKEIGMAWSYVYVPTSVQLTYCSEWRDDPDTL